MIPIRTCMACRKRKDKDDLIKITLKFENDKYIPIIDKDFKSNGRSIYLCKNINCINKFLKNVDKIRIKNKYKIDKDSLKVILENLKNEMGEKFWEK